MKGSFPDQMHCTLPPVILSGAEMDYPTAPVIREALASFAKKGIYGFTLPDERYKEAVCGWMRNVRQMPVQPEALVVTLGTIFGISTAIRAFTQPGDGVIIQHPSYYRFDRAVIRNHRQVISNPMICENGTYSLDFADLEEKMSVDRNRMMILCNPHNPTGKVFGWQDLTRIAQLAKKYNVIVISDEIFGETAQEGYPVVSYGNADPRGIVSTSFGKCFNFTGVNHANWFLFDKSLRQRYIHQQEQDHFGSIDPFFYQAVLAGYSKEGLEWIRGMNRHTWENHSLLKRTLAEKCPEIVLSPLEGGFVAWLDCSGWRLPEGALEGKLKEAGIMADPGEEYGPGGAGHIRINLATPRIQIERFLERFCNLFSKA